MEFVAASEYALKIAKIAAQAAYDHFMTTFSQRKQPVDAEEAVIPASLGDDISLAHLIAELNLAKSNSDARRLMDAGAVSLDGEKVANSKVILSKDELVGKVLKVGKHQFRKLVK